MKLYTATYDGNFPSNKEIQAPLGSKYGFALAFQRGSEKWELDPGEVTMDGLSADTVLSSGEFVFLRESGTEPGLKVHEVVADDVGVHVSADEVLSVYNSRTTPRQNVTLVHVDLSTLIDEPVEVTYDQLKIWSRAGSTEEAMLSSEFKMWNTGDAASMTYKRIQPNGTATDFAVMWPGHGFFWYGSKQGTVTNTVTLSPDGQIYQIGTVAGHAYNWEEAQAKVDTADVRRVFSLNERNVDLGEMDGYSEGGGDVPADVATKGWVEGEISGLAEKSELSAYATEDSLSAYATKGDATLSTYSGISPWTIKRDGVDITNQVQQPSYGPSEGESYVWFIGDSVVTSDVLGIDQLDAPADATSLTWSGYSDDWSVEHHYAATRTALAGYVLGSQTDKALQPAGDYVTEDGLSASLSSKVTAGAEGAAPVPSAMKTVYETAWSTLSANADANTFYVVLPDPE